MLLLLFALLAFASAHRSLNRFTHVRRQASTDLSSAFSDPSSTSSSTSKLSIGTTSLLTNGTHLLVSLPLTSGYSAIGRGASMASNTWMVVAYVPSGETTPTLEVRKSTGHRTPALLTTGAPEVTMVSNDASSVVFMVKDDTQAFNTNGAETFIYASSSSTPSGGSIAQHDGGKFGAFNAKFTATTTTTSGNGNTTSNGDSSASTAVDIPWTKYDSIILIHGIIAGAAWILIAPAAVLLARLGRNLQGWVKIHQLFQSVLTTILTITAIVLAVIAIKVNGGGGTIAGHKLMGFILLVLLITQVSLGYYIHEKFDANRTKRPGRNVGHIFLGVTLLVLGYVQVFTGLKEYQLKRPGYFPDYIFVIFWILAISPFIFYFISVGILIANRRRKDGMSWSMSMFGLGREGGSLPDMKRVDEKSNVLPNNVIQPFPVEKVAFPISTSGRSSPEDFEDEKAKASKFNFKKRGSKENVLPKSSKDLKRNGSWGNSNVEKFNRTNGLGSPSDTNADFQVQTFGAQSTQGVPQRAIMPGYEEPSRPMPMRAATLNYKQPAQYEYQQRQPMPQQQQQQGRPVSPPEARPRPAGQSTPQRSLTNDQFYQDNYYRAMQQPQKKNYLDLGE